MKREREIERVRERAAVVWSDMIKMQHMAIQFFQRPGGIPFISPPPPLSLSLSLSLSLDMSSNSFTSENTWKILPSAVSWLLVAWV
jgi:hypothetical protein